MAECCCALGASCITPAVPSEGPTPCSVLIVGQNPGAAEDLQGQPFVGRSGRLLRSILADAGLREGDYRLTNAVRCHTPNNRPPTTEEIDACRANLIAEVNETRPRVIVALGDIALRALCKVAGLAGRRGTSVRLHPDFGYSDAEVYPTYHPAFVLRVPQHRHTVVSDITRARRSWEVHARVPYVLSDSLPEGETLAYDIETSYWFDKGDTIIQAAVAGSGARTSVSRTVGLLEALRGVSGNNARTIVSHNGWAFDDPRTGVRSDYDTMALAYLDDESQPLGLEALCVKYLGVAGWKDARGNADPKSDEFALYNARDAQYTLQLYDALRASLGQRIRLSELVLGPATRALEDCSKRGVYVDPAAVAAAKTIYSSRADGLRGRLQAQAGDPKFNPNASRQVAQQLARRGHFLPPTKTGLASTGEGVLAGLVQDQFVTDLRAYRKASKAISAFVVPYERAAATGDGRVHPTYTTLRTATGRTSARALNIQQVARDPLIRAFLSAPPGFEQWYVDLSAVEFRVAAFVAGEQGIVRRYAADPLWDPHRYVAGLLYAKPEHEVVKDERQVAKSANFGLLYMSGPEGLQEYARKMGVVLTIEEARDIYRVWHEAFPGFKKWYATTAAFLREHGYIETITGRRRHFGDPKLLRGPKWNEALREAVNTQVQSPATGDISLLGLVACHRAGLPITGHYHDAISFEFREGKGEQHMKEIEDHMTKYPVKVLKEEFGVNFTVPLAVEAHVS